MLKRCYSKRLFLRVFFTLAILFLSLHLITGYQDTIGTGEPQITVPTVTEWTAGSTVITFCLQDFALMPHLRVMVNNQITGSFNNRYFTVAVQEGDSISLDGTFYNMPVNVEVFDASSGVIHPKTGSVLRVYGNVVSLGTVEINGS